MNGKFILLMMLCLNLMTFSISLACAQSEMVNCKEIGSNDLIRIFMDEDKLKNDASLTDTGFTLSTDFDNATRTLTKQQSGVSSLVGDAVGFFLDGLKIIWAIIQLITPFPLIAFLANLHFPLWVTVFIGLPIVVLYLIAIAELIGGRNL